MIKELFKRVLQDRGFRKFFIVFASAYLVFTLLFLASHYGNRANNRDSSPKNTRDLNSSLKKKMTLNANAQKVEPLTDIKPVSDELRKKRETRYANGTVSSEWVPSSSGIRNGVFRAFYRSGQLWLEVFVGAGKPEGYLRTFYPDGKPWSMFSFKNGQLSGENKIFYENGNSWVQFDIRQSVVDQIPLLFTPEGTAINPPAVSDHQNGGYFKVLDPSGKMVSQWSQSGGQEEGAVKSFFDDGTISSEWNLREGKLNGSATVYYQEQQPFQEYTFENGKMMGAIKSFYREGSVWFEMKPAEETTRGALRAYYPNGAEWFTLDGRGRPAELPYVAYSETAKAVAS